MFITNGFHSLYVYLGPSPLPLPPRQESYRDFLSWMSHEGAKFDKVNSYVL